MIDLNSILDVIMMKMIKQSNPLIVLLFEMILSTD